MVGSNNFDRFCRLLPSFLCFWSRFSVPFLLFVDFGVTLPSSFLGVVVNLGHSVDFVVTVLGVVVVLAEFRITPGLW